VERLITLARRALPFKNSPDPGARAKYLHHYRQALKKLGDKKMVQKLFGEGPWREEESLAERYASRPGGYTRIVRIGGSRLGVPLGDTVGSIPVVTYKVANRERSLKLIGNQLGDGAARSIFELVGREETVTGEEQEVAPVLAADTGDEPEEEQDLATDSPDKNETPPDEDESTPNKDEA